MKRISTLVLCALTVTMIGSCGKKEKNTSTTPDAEAIEKVEVLALHREMVARNIELSTTLEGYETMSISPSITGRIEHIYVEVGSRVSKGQMLVRMDQTQLNTTKINLANTKTELGRIETLRQTGSISQQAYDQAKAAYDQLLENKNFLEENTFVKAAFSGVISAKNYEDGELYGGQPILTLTQIGILKALINIPESYFPLVKTGMKINVRSEIYPDKIFPATIEIVYPTIDAATHTFQAKIKIPNSKELLRPGMFVSTTLDLGEQETIVVPYQAVLKLQGANNRYVFLNDNGVAKRVDVTLGARFDDKIEVLANEIKEGCEVVVIGQARLVDGKKLEIVNRK